ncbi:uncharacterized protein LOC123679985 isoform X3 [Harmonia axyridis]|uniref:uncharacterized protein LOC123679985 isoform X3 n=1 Tax=Harmonia axyridis TaxID=115357 RepID=UPI001E275C56|nr:uncharacterized protein LOC123679985 isoform X3 [Harmonia axyridis]
MGFFDDVGLAYGRTASKQMRLWAHLNTKLAKLACRRNFLLHCRTTGILPRHIVQNIKCLTNLLSDDAENNRKVSLFNKKISTRILNMEISFTIKKINNFSSTLEYLKTELLVLVPTNILERFYISQNRSYKKVFSNNKKLLEKKFLALKKRKIQSIQIRDEWLCNLTTTQIPTEVKVILSLGPPFGVAPLPVKDIPIKNIVADVENIINLAPITRQNILRAKCTNAITNFVHNSKMTHDFEHYLLTNARRFVKTHDDLVITPADKGNITVILSTEQYEQKMNQLLQDSSVYKQLRRDPTNEFQCKNNKIVKQLKDKGFIDASMARKLTTYKAIPPRIYGLPKVHKADIPLRPIVSTIGSASVELSQFMTQILTEAFSDFHDYTIADSFQFASKINNFILPQGYKLISLDAVSLFTNISLELVIQIIQQEWSRVSQVTTIDISLFIIIIKFLFESSYFVFKGSFISQIFGCAMGSKISPILANIVMSVLLKYCIPLLPFQVPITYQYVDDLLLAIPEDRTATTLAVFNNYDPHIKFTAEEETENGVPFLDTKAIRIKKICHPDFLHNSEEKLLKIFENNGYPRMFLNRCRHSLTSDQVDEFPQIRTSTLVEPATHDKYVSLPLIPPLTGKLTKILKEIENIKIAKYNPLVVGVLFSQTKDRIHTMSRSDVVYRIPCENCESVYVGQTSQCLKRRISIHKSDARLRPDRCALASHSSSLDHHFKFDEVEILCTNSNYNKRSFLEMCFINENENNINKKTDLKNLSVVYSYLLSLDRRPSRQT